MKVELELSVEEYLMLSFMCEEGQSLSDFIRELLETALPWFKR